MYINFLSYFVVSCLKHLRKRKRAFNDYLFFTTRIRFLNKNIGPVLHSPNTFPYVYRNPLKKEKSGVHRQMKSTGN